MTEVLFKGGKLQTGDRIKIPKAILDTIGLKSGDNIIIKFDARKKEFIVKRSK